MSTLKNLQKKIKINFKNEQILLQAITHKSYDPNNNYENLEFLGDRVLGPVSYTHLTLPTIYSV